MEINKQSRTQATATVLTDNNRVIITEYRFSPKAETGWHRHGFDYIVVPQTTGSLLMETKDGDITAELVCGVPYFRNVGVEHNVINVNEFQFVFIEVEMK